MSKNATMHDVAAEAGVSVMTVSRALRDFANVSDATKERVKEAAKKLNYRPDPQISGAMARMRSRKKQAIHSTIAVVREYDPNDSLHEADYRFVATEDIRKSAREFGYEVEEFYLGLNGLTPKRLKEVLVARGINGIIVSPQSAQLKCSEIDFSDLSSVTFGYALTDPGLHCAATNLNMGLLRSLKRLEARGYKRIGLAVTRWIDDRSQFGYSSALQRFQATQPLDQHVPTLLFEHDKLSRNFSAFAEWMNAYQPDVVISFPQVVPEWLSRIGLRCPEDVGFVVHDWADDCEEFAGLDHRRGDVASAAIDLLVSQMWKQEVGVPEARRQLLVPIRWVEGKSIKESSAP